MQPKGEVVEAFLLTLDLGCLVLLAMATLKVLKSGNPGEFGVFEYLPEGER